MWKCDVATSKFNSEILKSNVRTLSEQSIFELWIFEMNEISDVTEKKYKVTKMINERKCPTVSKLTEFHPTGISEDDPRDLFSAEGRLQLDVKSRKEQNENDRL